MHCFFFNLELVWVGLYLKLQKVTTEHKMGLKGERKNCPNVEAQIPLKELEVGPRSRPYPLVAITFGPIMSNISTDLEKN